MSGADFETMLRTETERYQQVRAFGALLTEESGLGTDRLVIVGGSALEIYTTGDYVSEDVDLVAERPERVKIVLRRWGFREDGMYWKHPRFPPWVQIPGRYDSGLRTLSQIVSTPYGPVRLTSMEDLVWKRSYEAREWRRPEALAEAELLLRRYGKEMDWAYLERQARDNGIADLLADLRRRYGPRSTRTERPGLRKK